MRRGGFTLIEVLVALAIFSIMAAASYRGLSAMLDARERVARENLQWRELALFFGRLENDLGAVLERPVRGTAGSILPALSGKPVAAAPDDAQLEWTRSGDLDTEAPRRVAYRLRGDVVELLAWAALDRAPRSAPEVNQALKGVKEFALRYLDRGGSWQTQWPPPGQTDGLPAALEVRLGLSSGVDIRRMFALP